MDENLLWKMTFQGRQQFVEDNIHGKTTFNEKNLRWKTTDDGRQPSMEDNLLRIDIFHER